MSSTAGGAGAVLKRRGILAAAALIVGGMVAKQVGEPVLAAGDTNFVATGGSGIAFNVATGGYATGLSATGSNYGVYSSVATGYGVFAVSTSGQAGVYGGGGSGKYGVQGMGNGNNAEGVHGESTGSSGIGVRGVIPKYVGVAPPVVNTAPNTVAVQGMNLSSGNGGIGVQGIALTGYGVSGSSEGIGIYGTSTGSYGIVGVTTAGGPFSGITGGATANGAAAFAGGTSNPNAYAAYFSGRTVVQGDFTVVGGAKNAAVRHTDGSYRLLHCVESPEPWFEDFGEAALVNGRADVRLDPDFAAVVETERMHVFAMPRGDSRGLTIASQSAAGFIVQELNGGTSSGAFAWRVVARRKDLGKAQRLERFEPPNIRIPRVDDLPEPPRDTAAPDPVPRPPSRPAPASPVPPAPMAATVSPSTPNAPPTVALAPPPRP